MRKLDKPTEAPTDILTTCISLVRNPSLKRRLGLCAQNLEDAFLDFEQRVVTQTLHEVPESDNVGGHVNASEMIKVYTNNMAKKGRPGRPFYDQLIALPLRGICPLCNQRIVTTLDHHLAKALHPALAIVPVNLVPSCMDCNKSKLDYSPSNSIEETLHPYYDDIENILWLKADVNESSPASLTFSVFAPNGWNRLSRRIKNHFRVLDLAKLYGVHAAEELSNIQYTLKSLFTAGGAAAVRDHLIEAADSRNAYNINSWQTAMYRALQASNWFCDGGFQA